VDRALTRSRGEGVTMARSRAIRRARPARRRDRGQRGAVVVEFALIVPMLLLLLFGIIEFGYMLNRDIMIGNASRDGARVASLNGTGAEVRAAITTELNASKIYPAAGDIKIDCVLPDGTKCNATSDSTYTTLAESGSTAIVTVKHNYKWITPIVSSLFGGTTLLEQTTQMRVE
jgi:Flp pilus assembly protein TadG